MNAPITVYKPRHHVRIITATSLFDGHDASTNIMRRILQDSGVEVIHLAHNRSVQELVDTAIDEDAQRIRLSMKSAEERKRKRPRSKPKGKTAPGKEPQVSAKELLSRKATPEEIARVVNKLSTR